MTGKMFSYFTDQCTLWKSTLSDLPAVPDFSRCCPVNGFLELITTTPLRGLTAPPNGRRHTKQTLKIKYVRLLLTYEWFMQGPEQNTQQAFIASMCGCRQWHAIAEKSGVGRKYRETPTLSIVGWVGHNAAAKKRVWVKNLKRTNEKALSAPFWETRTTRFAREDSQIYESFRMYFQFCSKH